jgi:two-component system sensor histidine kinase KdpD
MKKADHSRPDPVELLRQIAGDGRRRALFRVYMGYAPGCGATTSMLDEGRRRVGRGTDVVVAAHSVHDEPAKALAPLSVLGAGKRKPPEQDLDVQAVLARNPEVVIIDDLVGLDTQGRPRMEAVPGLIAAGITVLATVHVLSLRSAAAVIGQMLDEPPSEPLLDDAVLDLIDELEVVDIPPEDLLARIKDHAILTPGELAQAMQRELRPAVLRVLRETALRMVADHVDRQLSGYLPAGRDPLEFRGRVVLCIPIRTGMEDRIRDVARHAGHHDAKFSVVTVRTRDMSDKEKELLGGYAALAHQLGGEFVRLEGRNVAEVLARYIKESQATEVVIGHRRRSRWLPWDTTTELIRLLSGVDVHILRARPAPVSAPLTAAAPASIASSPIGGQT